MEPKPQVLFVHTNYPAQFRFLVKAFIALGWEVWFASHTYKHSPLPEIRCIKMDTGIKKGSRLDQQQRTSLIAFKDLLAAKRSQGLRPLYTYVHTGWGLGQFIKDIFPKTTMIAYSEWWFNLNAADFQFDPENKDVKHTQNSMLQLILRNQSFALELQQADYIVSPTQWQKSQLPKIFRDRCNVIFDGIDTDMFSPSSVPSNLGMELDSIVAEKPLLTYATRGLEPYRGFPEFIAAAEELLINDPDWHIAIAGADNVNYHRNPKAAKTGYGQRAKERFQNIGVDNRVHFVGSLPLRKYRDLLRRSNLHCYFTRPYVLSWSLLESALTGCKLFASSTEPVQEFLKNDQGTMLVDHTSNDLGKKLLEYSTYSKTKSYDEDHKRRSDRSTLVSRVSKSECIEKHFSLIGLSKADIVQA